MSSKRRNVELAKLARNYRVDRSFTDLSIRQYLSALDTPRSLAVWMLYYYQEHQQLVDLDIQPLWYNCPFRFRDDYAATLFLSKANFLRLDIARDVKAYQKFDEFELLCRQTNNRFKDLSSDPLYSGPNVWLLHATSRKIEQILGDFCGEELADEANWGPGVTTLVKGNHVSAVNKFHSESGITRDLYALIGDRFSAAYPRWGELLNSRETMGEVGGFTFQVGNSVVTVPKNSKTDRVIAIEPGINLWFQKAIGSMIRRRLQRVGVDLNSQERNQQLALLASKDATLATVDFSSASDSISRELVRELLPPRWFSLLNATRSTYGTNAHSARRWEKFSSMGNGFTFELESLIFFAAALSVREYLGADGEVSVFGDDVILPNQCFGLFSEFSRFLGFKVNEDKSFSTSPFRESCGSHYFSGVDCKPIFLKERILNVQAIYKLANSVRSLAHRRNNFYGCDRCLRTVWHHLLRGVPKPLRLMVPFGVGDVGFSSNFDEAVPVRARHCIEGYYYLGVVDTGLTATHEGDALLLARLKHQWSDTSWASPRAKHSARTLGSLANNLRATLDKTAQECGNSYTLRGRTRLRVSRSLIQQWYNFGEWV